MVSITFLLGISILSSLFKPSIEFLKNEGKIIIALAYTHKYFKESNPLNPSSSISLISLLKHILHRIRKRKIKNIK